MPPYELTVSLSVVNITLCPVFVIVPLICESEKNRGKRHNIKLYVYPVNTRIYIIVILTLCLSICRGLKLGSNNKRCGSKLTGDCLLPLLHSDHSGFIKPQNAGPESTKRQRGREQ